MTTAYGQVQPNGTPVRLQPPGEVTVARVATGVYCIDPGPGHTLTNILVATPTAGDDTGTNVQVNDLAGDTCALQSQGPLEVDTSLGNGVASDEAFDFFLPDAH